jgi:hypothetical protein
MGYLPGFVRRASLTLRLGSCLASFGEAQMANVLKKKYLSPSLGSFPLRPSYSPLFPSFSQNSTLKSFLQQREK